MGDYHTLDRAVLRWLTGQRTTSTLRQIHQCQAVVLKSRWYRDYYWLITDVGWVRYWMLSGDCPPTVNVRLYLSDIEHSSQLLTVMAKF